jgi:hypothetical protein
MFTVTIKKPMKSQEKKLSVTELGTATGGAPFVLF